MLLTYNGFISAWGAEVPPHHTALGHGGGKGRQGEVRAPGLDQSLTLWRRRVVCVRLVVQQLVVVVETDFVRVV